ncbi:MAG: serine O-acetyltransferase EpsC [Anaeroplasma sp.]
MNEKLNEWFKNKKATVYQEVAIETAVLEDLINNIKALLFPGHIEYVVDINSYLEIKVNTIKCDLIKLLSSISSIEKINFDYDEIINNFFNNIPEVDALLETDLNAIYSGDPAAKSKAEIILCYPGMYAIFVYRIAHILYKSNIPILPRALTELAHSKTGIDIHPGAEIGSYFFIDHGTGIVIGETSVIGNNVKIYQGVTIGALSLSSGRNLNGVKRHPTIKDNVTIYAGASVLGGESIIGNNVTIGSNAFITSSVEDDMIVTITEQIKKRK